MTDSGTKLLRRWGEPVEAASLVMLRRGFGAVMLFGILRFMAQGWVRVQYVEPRYFFKYWGFEWVTPLPGQWIHLHFAVLALLAACMVVGVYSRVATLLFTVGFAWVQLLDVTNYLNHYYLAVILGALLFFAPVHGSVKSISTAWLYLFRAVAATVYVHAGLAKLTSDWLFHAQPLGIWLSARTGTPVLGPVFALWFMPHLMSWAGFLFDTTAPFFLLRSKTRPWAYAVVVVFHLLTWVLFDIGLFPLIMITAATVFFAPSWPSRWGIGAASGVTFPTTGRPFSLAGAGAMCLFLAFHVLFPLRSHLYPNSAVLWSEQGMRFSWRVMAREKSGTVTFLVRSKTTGREWQVSPTEYLTRRQANEMAGQPDLIRQFAHHLAADFEARGFGDVEVRADSSASLNGRPAQPLIDPSVDLALIHDGVWPASWILPAPEGPPLPLSRPRFARTLVGE